MKKTILICGASGLIGRALLPKIRAKYELRELSSNPERRAPERGIFHWDIARNIIDEEALNNVDVIIYLSGAAVSKRWTRAHKERILESRGGGLDLIREKLESRSEQIEQLISASAIGIYPHHPERLWSEVDVLRPNGFLEESVAHWESAIFRFESVAERVCALRTSLVLDNHGGALPPMKKAVKWFASAAFGKGDQWMPWISLPDLVSLYAMALEEEWRGIYNAVTDNIRNKELMKLLSHEHDRPYWPIGIPKFVLKLILGENGALPYLSTKIDGEKIRKAGFHPKDPEIGALIRKLK
jgi:uncharacterized protein (TIGR01777 family)